MDSTDLHVRQRQAILDGDRERAVALATEAVRDGHDPAACIERGYVAGIREVGRLWEEGEFFLPELVQGSSAVAALRGVGRSPTPFHATVESREHDRLIQTRRGKGTKIR